MTAFEGQAPTSQTPPVGRGRLLLSARVHGVARAPLFGLGLAVGLTILLLSSQVVAIPLMRAGEVAPQTVRAPVTTTFVDAEATERARLAATAHLPPVYVIDRTANLNALRVVTRLAATVRGILGTAHSSQTQRATALSRALGDEDLGSLAPVIAPLGRAGWERVQAIVLAQLQYAANPNNPVTGSGVGTLIATASGTSGLDAAQRQAVHTLLSLFLNPNAAVDAQATAHERRDVLSRVTPITSTVQANQVIVRSGDVVDEITAERLQAVYRSTPPLTAASAAGIFLLALLLSELLHTYAAFFVPGVAASARRLGLLSVVVLVTVAAARLALPTHDAYAFAFPAAVAPMLIAVLLDPGLGLATGAVVALVVGQLLGGSFEMTTFYFCGSAIAALILRKVRRLNQFFAAGIWTSLCGVAVAAAFQLAGEGQDTVGVGTASFAALLGGGLAATLALGSFGALGTLFGVTTALQLLELSHPDHPLLRRLMLRAPGTYHHSLMIGNLVESAAEQIGADVLAARVMAYYHDIGKLESPTYFAENQAAIANIHDSLPPAESARLIRKHVLDGLRLARQYHLPKVIQDGIAEHHGLNLVGYFYRQALQEHPDQPPNVLEFTYPGPKPQSKETALLMLADGVEAACRAVDTSNPQVLAQVIHKVIYDRLLDGQLDECDLSMRDLALVERSFFRVLRGISHPRIKYPENATPEPPAPAEAKA